jgi:hypothetical protein
MGGRRVVLAGMGGVVGAVAFSADGHQVFLGGGEDEFWTVPIDLEGFITAVCQRTLRDLTTVEQTEYGLKDMAASCQ